MLKLVNLHWELFNKGNYVQMCHLVLKVDDLSLVQKKQNIKHNFLEVIVLERRFTVFRRDLLKLLRLHNTWFNPYTFCCREQ